jgi:hypothetical protein
MPAWAPLLGLVVIGESLDSGIQRVNMHSGVTLLKSDSSTSMTGGFTQCPSCIKYCYFPLMGTSNVCGGTGEFGIRGIN